MNGEPGRLRHGRSEDLPAARMGALRHGLLPFTRRHRGLLGRGLAFTCLLVASRLALPYPLSAIVDPVTTPTLPGWASQVTVLAGAFVSLALLAGMAEHFQRLAFAHFAGRTISDARSSAVTRIQRRSGEASGDLAVRVMADCARVKQGLKGVLNHITVNGLMVLGVCAALAAVDVQLGAVQLAGTGAMVVVAIVGATRAAQTASEHRCREALLAAVIRRLTSCEDREHGDALTHLRELDIASGLADTNVTRWEGITTWAAHIIFGCTASAILALGVSTAGQGQLDTGALFAVVAFLLLVHAPAVRFARQVARIGPLLVSAQHLGEVLLEDASLGSHRVT